MYGGAGAKHIATIDIDTIKLFDGMLMIILVYWRNTKSDSFYIENRIFNGRPNGKNTCKNKRRIIAKQVMDFGEGGRTVVGWVMVVP